MYYHSYFNFFLYIRTGLEQKDISLIYNYLKDLVNGNLNSSSAGNQPNSLAKFLKEDSILKIRQNTESSSKSFDENNLNERYHEFQIVYLGNQYEKYFLVPYNLAKLTFFIFIQARECFKLNILNQIDEILGPVMMSITKDIAEMRCLIPQEEKEIRYIYFNRLNLAQKSTIVYSKDTPKYVINLISELSKELEKYYTFLTLFNYVLNFVMFKGFLLLNFLIIS
jgi:hypothetical protein